MENKKLLVEQIERLNQKFINWNVSYSVYPYDSFTINELIMQIYRAVNDSVDLSSDTAKLVNALYSWVVDEGLKVEVVNVLNKFANDGTLEGLINTNIFNALNERVKNNENEIIELKNTTINHAAKILENKNVIDNHTNDFLKTLMFRKNLSNENLDLIILPGYYVQNQNVNSLLSLNYPIDKICGDLIVLANSDKIYQIFITYAIDNRLFIRSKNNDNWSNWRDLSNAEKLKNLTLKENNQYTNAIPYIDNSGRTTIGQYLRLDSENGNITFSVNKGICELDSPIFLYDLGTQMLKFKTYGNGSDYGDFINVSAYLNNLNGVSELLWSNLKGFNIGTGIFKGKELIVDNGVSMWNGSLSDIGDERKPYFGTRRSSKAWALADTNVDFWSMYAKTFDAQSDIRVKHILPEPKNKVNYSEIVKKITPKNFTYINDSEDKIHYGFIAQELEKVVPTSVKTVEFEKGEKRPRDIRGEKLNNLKFINVIDLVGVLWSAFKEQQLKVDTLSNDVNTLKSEILELKKLIIKE